jgi:hypothetical protein
VTLLPCVSCPPMHPVTITHCIAIACCLSLINISSWKTGNVSVLSEFLGSSLVNDSLLNEVLSSGMQPQAPAHSRYSFTESFQDGDLVATLE